MRDVSGKLRIDVVSQPLFQEAIKTLPFSPVHAEIRLTAFGEGIIPNSLIKMEYSPPKGFASGYDAFRFTGDSPTNFVDLIPGGRIKNIEIEMRMGGAEEGFNKFRDSLLPVFVNNHYELFSGDLWLDTFHLTGYNQGDYREGGLRFDDGWILKGLELDTGSMTGENVKKLEGWFNNLAEKYK